MYIIINIMPEFFSLSMPAKVYDIPIINEEISRKIEEINSLKADITLLSERIQESISRLSESNIELLTMYIQQQR